MTEKQENQEHMFKYKKYALTIQYNTIQYNTLFNVETLS